jgi:uncharacterized iron-regulated membrane protein
MSETVNRQYQARMLRLVRKIHRATGLMLVIFLLFIACTGILLGWKKHAGDLILPVNATGTTTDLSMWLPLDTLQKLALQSFSDEMGSKEIARVDRVDVRPDQGVVKFTFKSSLFEVQLDGATGELLKTGNRYSDIIEKIHDGSILDQVLGFKGGYIKLMYTSVMGIGLIIFSVTGFWLWYGPRRMRH